MDMEVGRRGRGLRHSSKWPAWEDHLGIHAPVEPSPSQMVTARPARTCHSSLSGLQSTRTSRAMVAMHLIWCLGTTSISSRVSSLAHCASGGWPAEGSNYFWPPAPYSLGCATCFGNGMVGGLTWGRLIQGCKAGAGLQEQANDCNRAARGSGQSVAIARSLVLSG